MERTFINRGGLWVIAQSALLTIAVFISVYFREQFSPFPFQLAAAILFFTLAAITGIGGVIALGKNRTPFPTPLPEGELVSTGIYRLVRHPLYLSLMLWAVSWALFWCSLAGLVFVIVLAVFLDLKARHEEKQLVAKHPEYAKYAQTVRRFLPGLY